MATTTSRDYGKKCATQETFDASCETGETVAIVRPQVSRRLSKRHCMGARSKPFVEFIDGTKFVRVMDEQRPEEIKQEISELRRSRWALLAHRNQISELNLSDYDAEVYRTDKALKLTNARLFRLTQNPIYEK